MAKRITLSVKSPKKIKSQIKKLHMKIVILAALMATIPASPLLFRLNLSRSELFCWKGLIIVSDSRVLPCNVFSLSFIILSLYLTTNVSKTPKSFGYCSQSRNSRCWSQVRPDLISKWDSIDRTYYDLFLKVKVNENAK